jgi:hypothetical protein
MAPLSDTVHALSTEFAIKKTPNTIVEMAAGFMLVCLISACSVASSPAAYEGPPAGAVKDGSGTTPIDPDALLINSNEYPRFHVLQLLSPPEIKYVLFGYAVIVEMVPIYPSDVWRVTHVFVGRYLIESDEYNERECRLMAKKHQDGYVNPWGKCLRQHDYAIFVTPSGEVSGGWQLLPGPQLGGSNRYTYLSYAPDKNAGWPTGPVFRASNTQD